MDHQELVDEMIEPLDEAEPLVQEQWSMVADAIDLIAFFSCSVYTAVFIILS